MKLKALAKSLSTSVVIYGLGDVLGRAVALVTAPVLTRIFSPADYGVVALLQATVSFFIYFAGLNLGSGVYFHYFKTDDSQQRSAILSTSFWAHIVTALVVALGMALAAPALAAAIQPKVSSGSPPPIDEMTHFVRIMAAGVVFTVMGGFFQSLLRMMMKPVGFLALSLSGMIAGIGATLILVAVLDWGVAGALWGGLAGQVVICSLGLAITWRQFHLQFSMDWLRRVLRFCLPMFPSGVLALALTQANRHFLNCYSTLDEQGLFAIAFQVGSAFLLFSNAFRTAWDPLSLSIMREENSRELYARVYSMYMVAMCIIGGALALFARPVLLLLTPEPYHSAYSLVFVLNYAFLLLGANNILGIGISLGERTSALSWAQAVSFLVNVVLNVLLIPRWHACGAAWALAGGAVAQSLAYFVFAQRVYPIPYAYKRLQLLACVVLLMSAIATRLQQDVGFSEAVWIGVAFSLAMAVGAPLVGLRPRERERVLGFLNHWVRARRLSWQSPAR